jgi:hypothetical protein
VPASFGADTPGSFDWAKDRLEGAATATKPLKIKAPHTARIMLVSM